MKKESINNQLDELLAFTNTEEELEHEAQMLAFQFLIRVDEAMEKLEMSKKNLAEKIGTSPAFITQLFRGDRKPNWNILAKMQKELNIDFKISTNQELDSFVHQEILDYHRKWIKTRNYENQNNLSQVGDSILCIDNDYALAG